MSQPPSHIIFVNRFYWPDEPATSQLLTDLAEALAARGHHITIITSVAPGEKSTGRVTHNGVDIIRVGGPRLTRKNLWKRTIDFARFLLAARRMVKIVGQPGDMLVAMTDPPLLGAALARIARQQKLLLVHWVQDIFPEVAMEVGPGGFTRFLRPQRDRAWREAAACVTLGEDMAAFIRSRGVSSSKVLTCANWAPAGLRPQANDTVSTLRQSWGLAGKFIVAYSGNLGRVHDLDPVIEAATLLREDPSIVFVFIGDGAQKIAIENTAGQRGLTNVCFFPAQPRPNLGPTLGLGDVHLITLRAGCERLVFPSKLYGIAAVGRPMIFVGPPHSEIASLIDTHHMGLVFGREQIKPFAEAIVALKNDPSRCRAMSHAAVEFSVSKGTLPIAVDMWGRLIASLPLAASRPPFHK